MHHFSVEVTIPLIILVGFVSSIVASTIGLGGGLIAIPLLLLVIGDHNTEAKLISYTSIAVLSIVSSYKYYKQKRRPEFTKALLILIGVVPATIVCELLVGPYFDKDYMKPYFNIAYAIVILFVSLLITLKHKIPYKGILPNVSLPFFGAFIGVLSGTFGLSGGILFVPLLVVGLKIELKEAAVTSLVLKLGASLANVATGAGSGQFSNFELNGVYWYLPLIILAGSIAGSLIGPKINKDLKPATMQKLFIVVMSMIFIWEITKAALMLAGVM